MKTDALYTTQHPDTLRDIALNQLATQGQKLALAQSENLALTRHTASWRRPCAATCLPSRFCT